jgi:lactate permease
VGLVGKESDLFRFTVKHSFLMLLAICLITTAQAYAIPWIIPKYTRMEAIAVDTKNVSGGLVYLLCLGIALLVILGATWSLNKKEKVA